MRVSEKPVEVYATQNWRALIQVLHTMSLPELRRALDLEWGGRRRRMILLRLTMRLCELERRARLAEVMRVSPKRTRGVGSRKPSTHKGAAVRKGN